MNQITVKQLDPISKRTLEILYKKGYAKIANLSVTEVRKTFSNGFTELPDQTINVVDGPNKIPFHIYYPATKKISAIIIYFHGGGYVIRQFSQSSHTCRRIAEEMNACVILIEYSLAPENKFPKAINEAIASINWVVNNKSVLSCDQNSPLFYMEKVPVRI